MDFSNFWHMDVGHVVTALIFAASWVVGKAMDRQKHDDKTEEHSRWIIEHKVEDEKRDATLAAVSENLKVLTALQQNIKESHEYRLGNLETDVRGLLRA
jgi:hypothetical protein